MNSLTHSHSQTRAVASGQSKELQLLKDMFQAAIDASDPALVIPQHLPDPPANGRTVVVGAGKAAAGMARAVERHWKGPVSGVVVTRYGHGVICENIEVIEASHPVPDGASQDAAAQILDAVKGLTKDDLVICVMSGGASALLSMPAPGISLADKQAVNKALLRSGANIGQMNCVRRHLSAIKGGRLADACGDARCVTLVISDVPGDDPAIVGSGPTIQDGSTPAEALQILRKFNIDTPASVEFHLEHAAALSQKSVEARTRDQVKIIATNQQALEAAFAFGVKAGVTPLILSSSLEGEAREAAKFHAAIVRQIRGHGQPIKGPCVLLSGGETTVTVRGDGRGGRNSEFLLALAVELKGMDDVWALAGDTDGIDGVERNAGCYIGPYSLGRAAELDLDAEKLLQNNDGFQFFSTLLNVVVTGATRTNVNDFRAILVQ